MDDKKKTKKNVPDYRLIKTGWNRLDKEKQDKLKSKGIHPLWHTPGKLLTGKGAIPGTLGAFGTVWGKMSWTGDKAEKNMGFRPKEGAKGVLLSRRKYVDENGKVKSGIFASSIMSSNKFPTKKQKVLRDKMSVLSNINHKYLKDLVSPIWEPLVIDKYKKPYDGPLYFTSLNQNNTGVPPDWSKLLISNGRLQPPPQAYTNYYVPNEKKIYVLLPLATNRKPITLCQIGIGILDTVTGDFLHISPEQTTEWAVRRNSEPTPEPIKITWYLKNVMKHHDPASFYAKRHFSRFYIYFYLKAPRSVRMKQKDKHYKFYSLSSVEREKPTPYNFSPSLCSRVRLYTDEHTKNYPRKQSCVSVEVSVEEQQKIVTLESILEDQKRRKL